jgi:hypothetical protein
VIPISGRASPGCDAWPSGSNKEETNMRGRYPSGPEYVEHLEGSAEAKRRAKVILRTLMGELRVLEACQTLGICEQRFHQLREAMLQAALARLEVGPAGRPRRPAEPAEVAALREQLAEQQVQLRVAQVREEIALVMPQFSRPAGEGAAAAGKKTTRRRVRPR